MKSSIFYSSLRNMCFFYIFLNPPHSAHLISKCVGLFESCVPAHNGRCKVAWEDELGAQLSDETWARCLTAVRSCSVNTRHRLIQFKAIHRLHYTETKPFHHSVISARSRRTQLLMLFGIVLHCGDLGLVYLISTLRPITDLFCWTWSLPFSALHNTRLPFQKRYNRPSLWVWSWPKDLY